MQSIYALQMHYNLMNHMFLKFTLNTPSNVLVIILLFNIRGLHYKKKMYKTLNVNTKKNEQEFNKEQSNLEEHTSMTN